MWLNTSLLELACLTVLMGSVVSYVWTGSAPQRHRAHTHTKTYVNTHLQTCTNKQKQKKTHTLLDIHTQRHTLREYTRGIDHKCMWCSERRWHQNMQKRLCRRPEIFNDESIHYRIRSLCFCCHEMYTFIISPPRTESIVPVLRSTLDGKFIKRKKITTTHKYKHRRAQTCILAHT